MVSYYNDHREGLNKDKTSNIGNDTLRIKLVDAKRSKACLVSIQGKSLGRQFTIKFEKVIIGRNPECDISIKDKCISKAHAEILRNGNGNFFIKDMESTNGSQLNNTIITPGEYFPIKDGDLIKLGNIIFKFLTGASIENSFYADILNPAMLDGLGGIYNRKYIMELLEDEFNMSKMAHHPFSIILLDIDLFKSINDTFEPLVGDFVHKETIRILKTIVREQDFIGRFGVDEFLILLSNTSLSKACKAAERIRQSIKKYEFVCGGTKASVTISLGVCSSDTSIHSSDELFKKADDALFNAKSRGGNQIAAS